MTEFEMKWLLGAASSVVLLPLFHYLYRYYNKKSVKGKTVLITGASGGLGETCAKVFHKAGCRVILCGRRHLELERVKRSLQSMQTENLHVPIVAPLDLTKSDELIQAIHDIIESCGRIDILVNNAGVASVGSVLETNMDVYRRVMEVNYFGPIIVTKAVVRDMIDNNGGSVVMVSSIQGRIGLPFRSCYGASKHALQGFSDCLRAEVASKNVHVCVVSPSYIKTQISYNSILYDGITNGKSDKNITGGMSTEYVSDKILECVEQGYEEMFLGPLLHRAAPYLRCMFPTRFFANMNQKASTLT